MRPRALRHLGLPGHERNEILIADRPRQQAHHQNAQAEGSVVTDSLRPFTRQYHADAHATDATKPIRNATLRNTHKRRHGAPLWLQCDVFFYGRINLEKPLTAAGGMRDITRIGRRVTQNALVNVSYTKENSEQPYERQAG